MNFICVGLTYSALENPRVHHEKLVVTCHHVINKKKQPGSYFVMRAGLRNNEFCLRGLTQISYETFATRSYQAGNLAKPSTPGTIHVTTYLTVGMHLINSISGAAIQFRINLI